MVKLVPDSYGSMLQEYNKCHNPSGRDGGRFCSTPGGSAGPAAPEKKQPYRPTPWQAEVRKPLPNPTSNTMPPGQPAKRPEYKRPTPLRVKTVEEAVLAILEGKVVELPETQQVSTVLERLAAIANEAKAQGKKAPNYDLCQVSVQGTNLFCVDKLRSEQYPDGVPRIQMPQMSGKPVPGSKADVLPKNKDGEVDAAADFIKHLKGLGIPVRADTMQAAGLKASQAELVGPKVAGMMTSKTYDPAQEPIFVSRDNYVVDGHHRWAAVVGRDAADGRLGDNQMKVVRVDAPISEVLKLANEWSQAFGIAQKSGK